MRDSNTGFTFFNVEGHQYDYDAGAQSLTITGGRLLLSKQFASALGIPSEAGSSVGTISVGAAMQPIQINQLVRRRNEIDGDATNATCRRSRQMPNLVPGPDVIVGDIEDVDTI